MVDLDNPFGTRNYDPNTGAVTPVHPAQPGGGMVGMRDYGDEAPAVTEPEYAWDNLSGQERAIWASVFGMTYVYVTNTSLVSGPYERAHEMACRAIDDHRKRTPKR